MVIKKLQIGAMSIGASFLSFMAITISLRDFGASTFLDSIFSLSSVPMAISGTITSVIIYILPTELVKKNTEDQIQIVKLITIPSIKFLLVVMLATYILGRIFNIENIAILVIYIAIGGLSMLSAISLSWNQATGKYLSTGYVPFFTSMGFYFGSLFSIHYHNEYLLVSGQLGGALIGYIVVTPITKIISSKIRALQLKKINIYNFSTKKIIYVVGATLPFALFQPIDALYCSLLPTGSMSTLAYAQRIVVALGTAMGVGMYAMTVKNANTYMQKGGINALKKGVYIEVIKMIVVGIVIYISYRAIGHSLLSYVFKSSSLSSEEIKTISDCIELMIFGLGPMVLIPYIFRIFYYLNKYIFTCAIGMLIPLLYTLTITLISNLSVNVLSSAFGIIWWPILIFSLLGIYFIRNDKDKFKELVYSD